MVGLRGANAVNLIAAGLLMCTAPLFGVGCSDVSLDASDDGNDTDNSDASNEGTGEFSSGGTDSRGSTDGDDPGAATTGAATTDSGSGGSTGNGTPDSDDFSCELDCGSGECIDEGNGPTCICPEGQASTGLDCIPCASIEEGQLPADVPSIQARFTMTVGGATPPDSPYETATIRLRNRVTGDEILVGRTHQANAQVTLIPGNYDVVYSHRQGQELPRNEGAVLQTLSITGEDVDHTIDVPTARLGGDLSIGGGTPVDPTYNYGDVWLVQAGSGDRVPLGDTRSASYDVRVIPGSYEVRYENRQSSGNAPLNTDARFMWVDIDDRPDAQDEQQRLHIDVPVVRFTGAVLIDGTAVTDPYEGGTLDLVDLDTGDQFNLGDTRDGAFGVLLVPGSYNVMYSSKFGGNVAPVNKGAQVDALTLDGDLDHDVRIETAQFSGSVTVDGNVPPGSTSDDGILSLRGMSSSNDFAVLGNTHDATFNRRVIEGQYEVFYAQETAGAAMPVNTQASLNHPIDLTEDAVEEINIDVVQVSGALTIDGAPAPDSPYDDGRLYLRNADTGDSVLLGNTRLGAYTARIVPGTYDIVYVNEFSDSVLPLNRGALVRAGVSLQDDAVLDIDISVASLSGQITVDGGAAPVADGLGQLFLLDAVTEDAIFLGHTGSPSFEKPLMSGRYIMEYRAVAGENGVIGQTLPANAKASFACYDVFAQ